MKKDFFTLLIVIVNTVPCFSQSGSGDSKSPTAPENSVFPIKDYGSDLLTRPNLLGDWNNWRNELAEKGITLEADVTQIFQSNARGGKNTTSARSYSGSADYWLKIDTQRMGLWPGGLWTFHGETGFGNNQNRQVGSIIPVNYDALLPEVDSPGLTTLSEYYLTQLPSEKTAVILGKIDPTSLADKNVFAADERSQFLNTAFRINPVLFNYSPYTCMAAALAYMPNESLTIGVFALDANGSVTRTGFDTAFHSPIGTTVGTEIDLKVDICGLPGNQRIGYGYSNKDYRELGQDPRVLLPPGSRVPESGTDSGAVWYNFDQYLFVEKDDPTQGVGIFGRAGFSDGSVNAIRRFYSFGFGGKGVICERNNDTFGVGYYYMDTSNEIPDILNVSSEQGVELFYNIEITKSIHFTPDFQWIIDPGAGFQNRDDAIVLGCRLQMDF